MINNAAKAPMLSLDGVSKQFGGITALNNVSLAVPDNGIIGLIGPNGAGKTTIFNVITGAYRANSGQVRLGAREITGLPPYRVARAGVARTFQNVRLFSSMTVWEHLLVAQSGRSPGASRADARAILGGA